MPRPFRWPKEKRRATKWRQHCSTCGVDFEGPQIWGYCSKRCEVSRDGKDDPGDLPEEVIEQMMDLCLQKEIAPQRLKQGYNDEIDKMERSHARKTFGPSRPMPRGSKIFWEYIMNIQFIKVEKARIRHNKELLRTIRRLCESESSGVKMEVAFPDMTEKVGLNSHQIREINTSSAIAKHIGRMPSDPSLLYHVSLLSDDEIEKGVLNESISPHHLESR